MDINPPYVSKIVRAYAAFGIIKAKEELGTNKVLACTVSNVKVLAAKLCRNVFRPSFK